MLLRRGRLLGGDWQACGRLLAAVDVRPLRTRLPATGCCSRSLEGAAAVRSVGRGLPGEAVVAVSGGPLLLGQLHHVCSLRLQHLDLRGTSRGASAAQGDASKWEFIAIRQRAQPLVAQVLPERLGASHQQLLLAPGCLPAALLLLTLDQSWGAPQRLPTPWRPKRHQLIFLL